MSPAALLIKTSIQKPANSTPTPLVGRHLENPNMRINFFGERNPLTTQDILKAWSQDKRKRIMTLEASKIQWLLGHLQDPQTQRHPTPLILYLKIRCLNSKPNTERIWKPWPPRNLGNDLWSHLHLYCGHIRLRYQPISDGKISSKAVENYDP